MAASEEDMMRGWRAEIKRKERPGRRSYGGSGREYDFTLDLHGLQVEAARTALDWELNSRFMKGAESGLVICGHGSGILLLKIGQELARHPLVLAHRLAENGRGAYVVELAER